MGPEFALARTVAPLDAAVGRACEGRERVVLAFSGGLASLILAALARKRGDLRCVVVGTRGAADVQAAQVAKSFLDYPVEVMRPSPRRALTLARGIHAADPRLTLPEVLSLVPLAFVEERNAGEAVLSGFGLVPRSPVLRRRLEAATSRAPGLRGVFARAPSRRMALRIASELGLPDAFARAPRRTPSEGSGIGPSMRAMGHARHASVSRLLDGVI